MGNHEYEYIRTIVRGIFKDDLYRCSKCSLTVLVPSGQKAWNSPGCTGA